MIECDSFVAEYWLSTPLMIIGGVYIASGAAIIDFGFDKNGVLLLGMVMLGTLSTLEILPDPALFCTPDNKFL